MKPAPFDYLRVADLDTAVEALLGSDAKVIAGGQSLLPVMAMRLVRPKVLVDVSEIEELHGVTIEGNEVGIGAMVTQAELEKDRRIASFAPLIAEAVKHIGHPAIRTRSTVGGSLCHADPAAEWPALAVLLEGTIETASKDGRRTISANDFFLGSFWTALEPSEVVVRVALRCDPTRRGAMVELARRKGDFAIAGAMVTAEDDGGAYVRPRVVAFGVSSTPMRLVELEAAIDGTDPSPGDLRAMVLETLPPVDHFTYDIHGSAGYRRRLLTQAVFQALVELREGPR